MNKPSPHLVPDRVTARSDLGKSLFVTANDGLRIHVRGIRVAFLTGTVGGLPAGPRPHGRRFRRTCAGYGGRSTGRHVIAIDLRGRGHSEHDADHSNYNCTVELADIVSVLIALGVGPAMFVGSSRGGVLTMMLATVHPRQLPASFCTMSDLVYRAERRGAAARLSWQIASTRAVTMKAPKFFAGC